MRQNDLDTYCRPLEAGSPRSSSARLLDQADHGEQIVGSKEGTAGGHIDERIRRNDVRPGNRD